MVSKAAGTHGENSRQITDPLSVAVAERDSNTIAMVAAAVRERRVRLAFQPVMQAARPDAPAFHEGLLRVLEPNGREIPARDFIEAVEHHQLGRDLDCLALEHGLWTLRQQPGLRLSINMSAQSIGYRRWTDVLERGLSSDPTIGERLILEITERSAILMPEVVRSFMADLQMRGVSFALDDFGAGYTALRHLRDFYFDILKIDGQFIRGIHASPDNQVLTQALIAIAKHFDMFTVAESVETAKDAEFLVAAGIDCLQGYFFGAPTISPLWLHPGAETRAAS